MSKFQEDIVKFNGIYKLPVATEPSLDQLGVPPIERLKAFKNILAEELDEIDEIIVALEILNGERQITLGQRWNKDLIPKELDILTMLADLLGDTQVYCASEMAKFGLPLDDTLAIIMQSNFSKLGADGLPIYDERGKVQKGPNYWKPEPKIQKMLTTLLARPGQQEAQAILDKQDALLRLIGAFDPLPIRDDFMKGVK